MRTSVLQALTIFIVFLVIAVSCKKDNNDNNNEEPLVVNDRDGNVYNTVKIGTQIWMKENLKTTKYRNGVEISTTDPATLDISDEVDPKYQWAYDGSESNAKTYGRLYTWHVVDDNQGICPQGWHVPTDAEWTIMEDYLIANGHNYDGSSSGNKIAKSLSANTNWVTSSVTGAPGNSDYAQYQNKSGFSALPGGRRQAKDQQAFFYKGTNGRWWTSSQASSVSAWTRHISFDSDTVERSTRNINYGLSVRCIKD